MILVLGTDLSVARENKDAVNLTFGFGQLTLIKDVTTAMLQQASESSPSP